MNRNVIRAAVAGALALGAGIAANAQESTYLVGRGPDWNLNSEIGSCHLRISVDDRASVQLHGDQVIVNTQSGTRSFDEGSTCTQPLPSRHVEDFRVVANEARGRIVDVREPHRRNNFTGGLLIDDPQPGASTYDIVVSWRNVDRAGVPPVVYNDRFPRFDDARACQERVRSEFLARNDGDAYLDFHEMTDRDAVGANRERIRGQAFARNRNESRLVTYECVMNDRTNRVLSASYDLRGPARYSSLQ
jgi:hypothetical protein